MPIAPNGVKLVDAPFEQHAQQTLDNIAAALKAATPPKAIALEEHFTSAKLRALRGEKDIPVQHKLDTLANCIFVKWTKPRSICRSFGNNSATQKPRRRNSDRTRACLQ